MLLREYAIEWWFIIPPIPTNVSALPRETRTQKLCLFSTPQACVHPHSPGECGWLWTEPVSYSKCSKWRPLAFPQVPACTQPPTFSRRRHMLAYASLSWTQNVACVSDYASHCRISNPVAADNWVVWIAKNLHWQTLGYRQWTRSAVWDQLACE